MRYPFDIHMIDTMAAVHNLFVHVGEMMGTLMAPRWNCSNEAAVAKAILHAHIPELQPHYLM